MMIAAACGVSMFCEKTTTLMFLDLELERHFIERKLFGERGMRIMN
jgi:hypothetical protein